jgi:hypothetical protein
MVPVIWVLDRLIWPKRRVEQDQWLFRRGEWLQAGQAVDERDALLLAEEVLRHWLIMLLCL